MYRPLSIIQSVSQKVAQTTQTHCSSECESRQFYYQPKFKVDTHWGVFCHKQESFIVFLTIHQVKTLIAPATIAMQFLFVWPFFWIIMPLYTSLCNQGQHSVTVDNSTSCNQQDNIIMYAVLTTPTHHIMPFHLLHRCFKTSFQTWWQNLCLLWGMEIYTCTWNTFYHLYSYQDSLICYLFVKTAYSWPGKWLAIASLLVQGLVDVRVVLNG
jgi:hypothetical protein